MADYEDVYAPDLTEETESTLSGSEQFVMFDSVEGKRAELSTIADYIVENGEIDGSDIPTIVSTIEGNIGTVDTKVGDLTDLETTDKTDIVSAVNEVNGKAEDADAHVGDLSDLDTTDKTSAVNAINEVNAHADQNTSDIAELKEDLDDINSVRYEAISIGSPYGTNGLISGDTGGFTANQYFTASDYIDISDYAGYKIKVTCGFYNASGLAFYKSDKSFISGVSGTVHGTNELGTVNISVPNNAAYIRFSIINTQGSYSDCGIVILTTVVLQSEIDNMQEVKDYAKRLILPPFVRMAEGIQYSFHHNNMIQGFRAIDCDFYGWQYGAQYDDYSTITPDSTKSAQNILFTSANGLNQYVNAKFTEPDMKIITKNMFLRAKEANSGNGKTVKGIFIGDSFTALGKYLYDILQTCNDNNITLQSLGTKNITVNNVQVVHEGRSGWKTSDYATQANKTVSGVTENNPFYHNGTFDFSYYMAQQGYSGLDFVALFTGVNDSISDSDDTILSSLTTIINSIHNYDTNIPVLLWLTPTRCIAPTNGFKRRYYNQNLSLVDCDLAQKYNCVVVDNFSSAQNVAIIPVGFNVDPIYDYALTEQNRNTEDTTHKRYMCSDPIHLNNNGYKHISDMVYGTILYLASIKD